MTPQRKVYYSGDGGYGAHFRTIGEQFGGFDLALLENGQYDRQWHRIHMLPDETAQAATDLRARYVLPAHNSKFALARHTWQAPMQDLATASKGTAWHLLTPEIGERFLCGHQMDFPSGGIARNDWVCKDIHHLPSCRMMGIENLPHSLREIFVSNRRLLHILSFEDSWSTRFFSSSRKVRQDFESRRYFFQTTTARSVRAG